jgi:hypothetical protein
MGKTAGRHPGSAGYDRILAPTGQEIDSVFDA